LQKLQQAAELAGEIIDGIMHADDAVTEIPSEN
jgi:hypothetical protein